MVAIRIYICEKRRCIVLELTMPKKNEQEKRGRQDARGGKRQCI